MIKIILTVKDEEQAKNVNDVLSNAESDGLVEILTYDEEDHVVEESKLVNILTEEAEQSSEPSQEQLDDIAWGRYGKAYDDCNDHEQVQCENAWVSHLSKS